MVRSAAIPANAMIWWSIITAHHFSGELEMKHAWGTNDAKNLDAIEYRHVPVEQHDIRIGGANGFERREPVWSFEHRLCAKVGEHSARESAHIGVVIDHQDINTLERLFDSLVGRELAGPLSVTQPI
jgi:hypothetical protein